MATLTLKQATSNVTLANNAFLDARKTNNKDAIIAAYANLFLANVAKHRLAKNRKKVKK